MEMPQLDAARLARWTSASLVLGEAEPFMELHAQGLGRKDCQLRVAETLVDKATPTQESAQVLTSLFYESTLWLLGAYELVRALDQRCRDGLFDRRCNEVAAFKRKLAEYRMPLAKYERAGGSKRERLFPSHGVSHEGLIAWRVADDAFVTREGLGEDLLLLLERIAEDFKAAS